MRFRHYDGLRIFSVIARYGSFSAAAEKLNLTKGAVSYQIRSLESVLGFEVFQRLPKGVALTPKGQDLLNSARGAFDDVERTIDRLRGEENRSVTLGVTTYFASRWLSPRLMDFMKAHPSVRLRIQPMIDLVALDGQGIDLAIRWGDGNWDDVAIEPLFLCPAFATGPAGTARRVEKLGMEAALHELTLLKDRDGSRAWEDWFNSAGLCYHEPRDTLVIPDPNVRVQAVIDGQGIALNDDLVAQELGSGRLERVGTASMDGYGYFLAHDPHARTNRDVEAFADWLQDAARKDRNPNK